MNQHASRTSGLEASFSELVRSRPDRKITGFAPGGKVRTHQFGTNQSVFQGRGMEFDEARVYQPGDDVRSIDWRVTARTGTMHTKLFHEERERPVLILLDERSSMKFGTRRQFKSVLAAHIAAKLAWTGHDGGDRVGGFIAGDQGTRAFPAKRNQSAVLAFIKAMGDATMLGDRAGTAATIEETPLRTAIDRLRKVARPGTLVFIVSDFDDFDERTERSLKRLSLHAHVTNILVHDQLDAALPRGDGRKISDGNAVAALASLPAARLQQHAQDFAQRRERLERASRQRSMAFLVLSTSDSADVVLHPHRRRGASMPVRIAA